MALTHKYPKGSIINFTTGDYSDFRNCGMIVAVKDIDLCAIAQSYASGKERYDTDADTSSFASHLIATGYAMPVDVEEVHLGSYGEFDSEFGVEYANE